MWGATQTDTALFICKIFSFFFNFLFGISAEVFIPINCFAAFRKIIPSGVIVAVQLDRLQRNGSQLRQLLDLE